MVGVVRAEGAEADPVQRWFSSQTDARWDTVIVGQIAEFIGIHAAKSVVLFDRIIGCPREEKIGARPQGSKAAHGVQTHIHGIVRVGTAQGDMRYWLTQAETEMKELA